MSDINLGQVQESFDQAGQVAQQATSLSGAGANLERDLREALASRSSNSHILQGANQAAGEFFNVQPQIRADMAQMVQNQPLSAPTIQAIESARRSAAVTPLVGANRLANIFTGGLENIVRGGVDAFRTAQDAAIQRASLMRQRANDLFGLYQNQQDQRQRQFENELTLRNSSGLAGGFLQGLVQQALAERQTSPTNTTLNLPSSFIPDNGQELMPGVTVGAGGQMPQQATRNQQLQGQTGLLSGIGNWVSNLFNRFGPRRGGGGSF